MRLFAAIALLLATTAIGSVAVAVTFADANFNDPDWSLNVVASTGGTVAASQTVTGGNPGSYRLVTNQGTTPPAGSVFLAAYHLNSSFVYDPSVMGPIDSIEWNIDYQNFSSGQSLLLGIQQGGSFFAAGSFVTTSSGTGSWFNHAPSAFTAGDFTGAPDFSAAGAPITFGFRTANSGQLGSFEVGYDNISITVTPVPEPHGLALLLVASALLGTRRTGRTRQV